MISIGVRTDWIRCDRAVVKRPKFMLFHFAPTIQILFMATWHLAGSLHYIEQQLEHHRTRTFQEEYLAFLKKTGLR